MADLIGTPPQGLDPIDQYLTGLQEFTKQLEENVPRLEQGIDQILGGSYGNLVPNVMPKGPAIHKNLGSYDGLARFGTPPPKVQANGSLDKINSMIGAVTAPGAIAPSDASHLVRKVGFGNGPGKLNFDRYYNSSAFNRLGWNPYMDMESFYNENSSGLEDMGRATGQWLGLAGIGFKQMASNWDNLLTADVSGDTKYAAEMNRKMAIASSSRGGFSGFAANQWANSAYSAGFIAEIIGEELALAAATYATKGLGLPAALLRTGKNLDRLLNLGDFATGASKLAKGAKTVDQVKSTATAVNAVGDISSARKFWNGVKSNSAAVLNFANPLTTTVDTIKAFKTDAKGFSKVADFAANSGTFGAFFKDAQQLNAALAESRLEGGFVQNDVLNNLLGEHYKNSAAPPTDKEAQDMISQAKLAGIRTTMLNAPAVLYSNKIVFDKLFGGFRGFKDTPNAFGTVLKNYGAKAGEKKFTGFIDTRKISDIFSKKGVTWAKNGFRPKNLIKNGLRYTSANLTEGLQEVYQESVSKAMADYYTETYGNPERAGTGEFMTALGKGVSSQFSGQGAETFLSGFLMGGMLQVPQTIATQTIPQAYKDYKSKKKDPKAFEERKKKREEDKTTILDFLNKVAEDPKQYYDPIYANVKAQKDFSTIMTEADEANNKKEHADASQDSLFNHVSTLINRGYTDVFIDQISEFEKMTDEELSDAFAIDKTDAKASEYRKDLRSRVGSVKKKVDDIQKRYDKYSAIQNPFDSTSKDANEVMDHYGFEEVRKAAIYNDYTFDRASSRMSSILNNASSAGLGGVLSGKITSVLTADVLKEKNKAYGQLDTEIDTLKTEILGYKNGTAEQKTLAAEKQKQLDALISLKDDISGFNYSLELAKAVNNKESVKEAADTVHAINTVEKGDIVDYTPKKKKAIKGTVVKKNKTTVTIEYTENGKVQRKLVKINGQTLSIAGKAKPSQTTLEFDNAVHGEHIEKMREALGLSIKKYLATISGLPENSTQLDKLVADMVDYYELAQDAQYAANLVNILNDPKYFLKSARMLSEGFKLAKEQSKKALKESLDKYLKKAATNKVLQDLFEKYQVFFDPDDITDFLNGNVFPSNFYDANTLEPIPVRTAKFNDIYNFIKAWGIEEGFLEDDTKTETTPGTETGTPVPPSGPVAPTGPVAPAAPVPPAITKQITPDTPLGEFPTELVKILKADFNTENTIRENNRLVEMTDEEFPRWVKESSQALNSINIFNESNGLAPVAAKRKQENIAWATISNKSTREEVENAIKTAPTANSLREIQGKITEVLLNKTGLTKEEINQMVTDRTETLEKLEEKARSVVEKPNFDAVIEGSAVIMKDKNKYKNGGSGTVVSINRGENPSITLNLSVSEDGVFVPKDITLSKEEFETQTEIMITKGLVELEREMMEESTETPPVTAEEQEVSNENYQKTTEAESKALDEQALTKAEELGEDEATNNLLNKLGCK